MEEIYMLCYMLKERDMLHIVPNATPVIILFWVCTSKLSQHFSYGRKDLELSTLWSFGCLPHCISPLCRL